MWHVSQKPLFPGCDEYKKSYPVADQSRFLFQKNAIQEEWSAQTDPMIQWMGKHTEQERISWLFNCWCKFRRRCQQFDVHIAVEKNNNRWWIWVSFHVFFPKFSIFCSDQSWKNQLVSHGPPVAAGAGTTCGTCGWPGGLSEVQSHRQNHFQPPIQMASTSSGCKVCNLQARSWKGWSSKMRCSFLFTTVCLPGKCDSWCVIGILWLFSLFSQSRFWVTARLWGLSCHNSGVFPGSWCLKHVMFFWTKMIVINPIMMGRVRNCGDSIFAHYFATICRRCHFRYGKNEGE